MRIITGIIVLFLALSQHSFAQKKKYDPTPGDIQKAKQLKDKYPDEDDRVAITNCDIEYTFGYAQDKVTVHEEKEEGYISISSLAKTYVHEFYNENSEINKFEFRGRINNKLDKYVSDTYYENGDFFYNDARVKSSVLNFPVQGYIYTFLMEKEYFDIKYFTSVYLRDIYPIEKKTVSFTIPKWLDIELKELNFDGFSIEKKISEDGGNKVYTYTISNTEAQRSEDFMLGPSYFEPHILILPKAHHKKSEEVTLFKETGDLYSWYKSLVDQMEDNPEVFKEKVEELTKDATTDEEKIKSIYYWVQDNIRYIAFEDGIAGFKPDESNNVYEKKYGDCKGMANLLKQMLVLAGFDARLTWIGTSRIAYDYSTPNLSVDNHMICTLNHNGKRYFLDGTQKFNAFGEYAGRIQGRQVLIEDGKEFVLDYVPEETSEANKEYFVLNYKIENDALVGDAHKKFNGESRAQFLYRYNSLKTDKKEEALKKYLNENDKNVSISEIKTSELTNREGEVQIDYNLNINNRVTDYDGEYYVDIDYFKEYSRLEFEERENDYYMGHKTNYISQINLQIPEGYKVSYKPEDIEYNTENVGVNISYQVEGSTLTCIKTFNFKTGLVPKSEFEEWQKFNKTLVKTYNDQITLSKQ